MRSQEGLRRAVKNRLRSGNEGSESDLDWRAQELAGRMGPYVNNHAPFLGATLFGEPDHIPIGHHGLETPVKFWPEPSVKANVSNAWRNWEGVILSSLLRSPI
jgi:hypothetical protein